MNIKPTIVSDLGGVIYSFSKSFNPVEHEDNFVATLSRYSKNYPKYKQVLENYNNGNLRLALDIEKEAVIKGVNNQGNTEGILPLYFNLDAVKKMLSNTSKFLTIIVSTSRKETSLAILKESFTKAGLDKKQINNITSKFEIYDMSQFGSKKDSKAWKQILKNYQKIVGIVEDSEKNLAAAFQAAVELKQNPKTSLVMIDF